MYQSFLDSKEVYQILNGDMQVGPLQGTCVVLNSLKSNSSNLELKNVFECYTLV